MKNPLSRLFGSYSAKATNAPSIIHLGTAGTTLETFDDITDRRNLKQFDRSLYLYIGVTMIAKRAAGIELELHKIKNQQGETEEVYDHDVLDLFYNPNPFQTQREFMETSVAHYLLSGDVFWYHNPDEDTLYPLRPDHVEIILSPDQTRIIAYEYRMAEVVRFKPEDIIHIKNPNPSNVLRGSGVVRPATSRIVTEQQANEYQANFFMNQGRPDVAIFADREVSPEDAEKSRRSWAKIFSGKGTGKAAFFGSDVRDLKELNKTPKEMDFTASLNFLRDDILAALRIPKAMVTSDDVSLANAKEAYRMYLQEAVVPVMDAIVDAMNNRLLLRIDDTLFFTFQDPTPNDREMLLKEATELTRAGIITANEARERYEMDTIEGGDELKPAGNNLARVENAARRVLRRRKSLRKRFAARDAILKTLDGPKRQMNSIFATKEMKVAYAKAVNDRIDRKAETMLEAIIKYLDGLQERILASDLTPNSFMDVNEEKIISKRELTPILVQMYKDGGQQALDALFRKADDTFFADEVLLAAIQARAAFFTESMTETAFEILKGKIATGISNGDGPDTIARNIREHFDGMKVGKAKTIARTETSYAISKATNDAYSQSSVVTGKEWLSAGDGNVRPEHVENNGVIVAKFGTFPNGEEYPGHHSINCRCVLLPTV